MPKPLTIHTDGTICRGTTIQRCYIHGSSPRVFHRGDGIEPGAVDITHVYHSHALPAILEALLTRAALPAGFEVRERHDGMPIVGIARAEGRP
jgi:hypothetical protein